jgi:hypothetical protein
MLTALLFLAALSNAQPAEDKVPGGSIGFGCTSETGPILQEAIMKAGGLAEQCLTRDNLNPSLAKRLQALANKKITTFHCNYDLNPKFAGLTWDGEHGPEIQIDHGEAAPGRTNYSAIQEIDLTVFHELLHAIDTDTKMVGSDLRLHNLGQGIPDAVYGCETACRGYIPPNHGIMGMLNAYEIMTDSQIPELKSWACKPGTPADDCAVVRKFAWLCRNAAPIKVDKKKVRRFKEAYCTLDALEECEPGKCAFDWGSECRSTKCPPVVRPYESNPDSDDSPSPQGFASEVFDLALLIDQSRKIDNGEEKLPKDPLQVEQLGDIRTAMGKCSKFAP